jgi:single-strand DNA-binding protein
MTGVNKAIIVGHLGADPEIRRTQSGAAIASFSLATSERWTDKATGEKRERTEWHRVVIFSEPLVKVADQYLKKGSKAYVEGAMATRKWTDAKGVERFTTEVVLNAFNSKLVLLDRVERAPAATEESYGAGAQAPAPAGKDFYKDEIPF